MKYVYHRNSDLKELNFTRPKIDSSVCRRKCVIKSKTRKNKKKGKKCPPLIHGFKTTLLEFRSQTVHKGFYSGKFHYYQAKKFKN